MQGSTQPCRWVQTVLAHFAFGKFGPLPKVTYASVIKLSYSKQILERPTLLS